MQILFQDMKSENRSAILAYTGASICSAQHVLVYTHFLFLFCFVLVMASLLTERILSMFFRITEVEFHLALHLTANLIHADITGPS